MSKENTSVHETEFLEQQLLKSRTVLIYGEINQELARKVTTRLLALDSESKEPITIFVNSQGGHVEAGDTIHDIIRFIESPVNMVGTGWVASAGITIYLAAEKDRRFSLPNTRYMIHQPMGGTQGQATDISIEAKEIIRIRDRINKLISDATGQSYERVAKDTDRNFWLSAQEAVDYGIVSRIIQGKGEIK